MKTRLKIALVASAALFPVGLAAQTVADPVAGSFMPGVALNLPASLAAAGSAAIVPASSQAASRMGRGHMQMRGMRGSAPGRMHRSGPGMRKGMSPPKLHHRPSTPRFGHKFPPPGSHHGAKPPKMRQSGNWHGGGNWKGGGNHQGGGNWSGGGTHHGGGNWSGGGKHHGGGHWQGGGKHHGSGDWQGAGKHHGKWGHNWSGKGHRFNRINKGGFVSHSWFGSQFHIGNWSLYGFSQPFDGGRWIRYYDDALLIDRYGRVHDGRYGVDWDRYGERWDDDGYDGYDAPAYADRGDHHSDESYDDWSRNDALAGSHHQEMREHHHEHGPECHGSAAHVHGSFQAYGHTWIPVAITETTVTTSPVVETRTYHETRHVAPRVKRKVLRRAPPPPPPLPGERG